MRILLAPLDWGLGHAARCVPLIRALRGAGHEVFVYASGAGRKLLQGEFPGLEIGELPSYAMRYSRSRFLTALWLFAQLPLFLLSILRDRLGAGALVRKHGIGAVISDSRYGFRAAGVPCFFVTHQLRILPPGPARLRNFLAGPLERLNRLVLRGFSEIWVPDFPGAGNLSGRLGHPRPVWNRVRYLGPLCRFRPETLPWDKPIAPVAAGPRLDVLALVSGPEPQRTVFEKQLRGELENLPGTRVLVRGLPGGRSGEAGEMRAGALTAFDHLPGDGLLRLLAAADRVICRSGYTTVMELAGLGKKRVRMVPTPGQPEQEYLAEYLREADFSAFAGAAAEGALPLSEFVAAHPLLRS